MTTDPKMKPLAYIIERVAEAWGVTVHEMLSTKNGGGNYHPLAPKHPLIVARGTAMMIARDLLPDTPTGRYSNLALARAFNRHPSTLRSNIKHMRRYVVTHRLIGARIIILRNDIRAAIALESPSQDTRLSA